MMPAPAWRAPTSERGFCEPHASFIGPGARPSARTGVHHPIIEKALAEVKNALDVLAERDWLRGHYQFCNRLAALYFLVKSGIGPRPLRIYFCGDQNDGLQCPQAVDDWERELSVRAANRPGQVASAGGLHVSIVLRCPSDCLAHLPARLLPPPVQRLTPWRCCLFSRSEGGVHSVVSALPDDVEEYIEGSTDLPPSFRDRQGQ